MTNPAPPPEPCCTGPFSDARECPVHDPRKSPPAAEADVLARRVALLADTFAMECMTGHYRPLRAEEQPRYDQLRVVMLAFAAQVQRLAGNASEADALARLRSELDVIREVYAIASATAARLETELARVTAEREGAQRKLRGANAANASCAEAFNEIGDEQARRKAAERRAAQAAESAETFREAAHLSHEAWEREHGRAAQAVEALRSLVEQLDAVAADPRYVAVWTLYAAHGESYTGPFYIDELTAAKAALAAVRPESKPSTGARYDNNRSPYILRAASV